MSAVAHTPFIQTWERLLAFALGSIILLIGGDALYVRYAGGSWLKRLFAPIAILFCQSPAAAVLCRKTALG